MAVSLIEKAKRGHRSAGNRPAGAETAIVQRLFAVLSKTSGDITRIMIEKRKEAEQLGIKFDDVTCYKEVHRDLVLKLPWQVKELLIEFRDKMVPFGLSDDHPNIRSIRWIEEEIAEKVLLS